jgi:hypothetical protein
MQPVPEELLFLVERAVACGCCAIDGQACVKIVQWVQSLYYDKAADWIEKHEDVVNDLYLFYLFDHDIKIEAAPEE